MRYSDIRANLKTGDVVAINTGNRITQLFQRLFCNYGFAQYTHVGVLVWRDNRLYVSEMDGRYNVERSLSQYINARMPCIIFPQDMPSNVALQAINAASDTLKHYDVSDFFSVGLRVLFKVSADANKKRLLCTQYTAQILRECGVDIADYPLAPSEVCAFLHKGYYIEVEA